MSGRAGHRIRAALALCLAAVLAACASGAGGPGGTRPVTAATREAARTATTAAQGPGATATAALRGAAATATVARPGATLGQAPEPLPAGTATPADGASRPQAPAPPAGQAAPGSGTGPMVDVLLDRLMGPEDVTAAFDGTLYFSGNTDGTVQRYTTTGKRSTVCTGLSGPEGIAVLPDGGLVVAEQGKNRITLCTPGKPNKVLLQLENRTGQLGVDGIALDAAAAGGPWLIVPDSANGTVLRVSLDGKQVRLIGRGFVRPVAAWVEKDGSILVADEFGLALKRLRPDATLETVAELATPDDVVEDGRGNIYVTTLGDKAVHLITPDGANSVLAGDLGSPQGLAFDLRGNLVVADPGQGRLLRINLEK